MTSQDSPTEPNPAEASLGQALVLLQRVAARLDEPVRAADVQATFRRAAACLEAARAAHEKEFASRLRSGAPQRVATSVAPQIAAVIAAAIAETLPRSHRLISIQPASAGVPHLNVWALEGRTQLFHSHKIR